MKELATGICVVAFAIVVAVVVVVARLLFRLPPPSPPPTPPPSLSLDRCPRHLSEQYLTSSQTCQGVGGRIRAMSVSGCASGDAFLTRHLAILLLSVTFALLMLSSHGIVKNRNVPWPTWHAM